MKEADREQRWQKSPPQAKALQSDQVDWIQFPLESLEVRWTDRREVVEAGWSEG